MTALLLAVGGSDVAAQPARPAPRLVASHVQVSAPSQAPSQKTAPGALSKAHEGLAGDCESCHSSSGEIASTKCLGCHEAIAQRIRARKGVHRDVTGDCQMCHAEHRGPGADLRPLDRAGFDHAAETGFPLTGAHAVLRETCERCHKTRSFLGQNPSCSSCHQDPHGGQMPEPCSACHTPAGFRTASRAFHKGTTFPLEGRHLGVPCRSCHVDGAMKGTPTRCYDCHWIRRQDDRYKTRLGNECEQCHRPVSWTAVDWDHGARTGLPLNASHRMLACESCHKNATFVGARPECFACHEADYRGVRSPNHVAAGFPTTCDLCHTPSAPTFAGARFVHTSFVLTGSHATQACAACHRNNVYQGTPRECVTCHLADYQRAQNPNHASAGFPTACDGCHRSGGPGWSGTFNHAQVFALQGVHAAQACSACHAGGRYRGTPRDCAGCHLSRYQSTRSPNHLAAGFPATCDTCHRAADSSWSQGRFTHTAFPITSGKHAGTACAQCHVDANNFRVFSCLTCHDRGKIDREHSGRPGYRYDSNACYSCHPQGRAD
jgi:hypothetical protein